MKIQDVFFFIVLTVLFFKRKPRFLVIAGLACLALSIPLFYFWIFFTADRLTWYAAAFFLVFYVYATIKKVI
ncbi:hypothetical protein A3A79_05070 [Candidatus Gottesmanbacteria bacterium RIFCSPLOWO2_01_FULL_43_11b]|uniref:Uncharacterized protein n=1 Tax=Candidatus Gottesmanbacteria bacterium RIFCSPLOWO2_01_FULL_43_11b TaxID=1798392 RepID=A0A1F6AIS4_9BACT|nr:MAG: hypothetical protein A3A79_05070 [Candidatus Gottesmanbacteria bacterium RIFCSPLOWO2_01_FULL_43_11b]